METTKITHTSTKCRSGFPTAMIETGKSLLHIQEINFQITRIIGEPAYAKASADNRAHRSFNAGGPAYAKASVDSPSWLTHKTTDEASCLVVRLEASPIKEAPPIEEVSSVVYLCLDFQFALPTLIHLRKSYGGQELWWINNFVISCFEYWDFSISCVD